MCVCERERDQSFANRGRAENTEIDALVQVRGWIVNCVHWRDRRWLTQGQSDEWKKRSQLQRTRPANGVERESGRGREREHFVRLKVNHYKLEGQWVCKNVSSCGIEKKGLVELSAPAAVTWKLSEHSIYFRLFYCFIYWRRVVDCSSFTFANTSSSWSCIRKRHKLREKVLQRRNTGNKHETRRERERIKSDWEK